ncbi:hypothetical protein E2C01_064043 [Portunus trituberculatus]|uniref:Uncharacterized protein n=1 Tax=Portunus trituberculatus TaxID=210409 RepID=A0A5B7HF89_PORTR|nr:hypothetical protein [Portunus trituberculatus]
MTAEEDVKEWTQEKRNRHNQLENPRAGRQTLDCKEKQGGREKEGKVSQYHNPESHPVKTPLLSSRNCQDGRHFNTG